MRNKLVKAYFFAHSGHIDKIMRHSVASQELIFKTLIKSAQCTQWGKSFDYQSIKDYAVFSNRLPINSYEQIEPYISRMMRGEKDVLWRGKISWFSKSSGTSNARSKYIPVSRESLWENNYKCGRDTFVLYLNNCPNSTIFGGKYLSLTGALRQVDNKPSVVCGDISAILTQMLPFWANTMRTPPKSIALLDNWEEKVEVFAQYTKNQDVRIIGGVPSWLLIIFKRIMEITGKSDMSSVWQDVQLFMYGGVTFSPYKEQYQALFPNSNLYYQQIYNSSEGYFAAQDRSDSEDMLLLTDNGIFYEFIPFENISDISGKAIPLEAVKTGQKYALVISTNAGLWRYRVGDVIEFTSIEPYRISICGRTSYFINAFGEELMMDNADKALQVACNQTNAVISEYTAAPIYLQSSTQAAHEWLIEFETQPSDLQLFTKILDAELKKLNSDYDAKRANDILLQSPLVCSVKKGTFLHWLADKQKLGGQYKVPRLSNDRKMVEEIKRIIDK
ncbi:MAG: GH3 auxin-responsive promoter family protein [Bacteroidales bacterium]|jgi:hypothetical protein|nr:GH3 auxin-responsive promoter family protein [Bacteroidales bacterium]